MEIRLKKFIPDKVNMGAGIYTACTSVRQIHYIVPRCYLLGTCAGVRAAQHLPTQGV